MTPLAFQSKFDVWLDRSLDEASEADDVAAFSFNLGKPWSIEVVGCGSYDEDDEDWATEEIFRPATDALELPESVTGNDWESVLEFAKALVGSYLARPSIGSGILKNASAVAVGFVDGEIHKVWP